MREDEDGEIYRIEAAVQGTEAEDVLAVAEAGEQASETIF